MKNINKALIITLLFGVGVRLYMCLTRNVFTDEVFYYTVTKDSSIIDILTISHWIKDHAILHFILLKIGLLFTPRIAYLRLINIFLYLGSALALYKAFRLLKFGNWALLPVVFFSFYGYFINITSMILPYNLVIFFSIFSILYCVKVFLVEPDPGWGDYFAFIVFTVLASYSDYSFLSMFLFYLFTIFFVAKHRKTKLLSLFFTYCIITILVLPGMAQLYYNFDAIKELNVELVSDLTLSQAFLKFCELTFLHTKSLLPLSLFGLYFLLFTVEVALTIKKRGTQKEVNRQFFLFIIGGTYYFSVISYILINQYIFKIFVERASWFFPLFALIMVSVLVYFYYKKGSKIYILIILIFIATRLSNMFITEGNVMFEAAYKSFLDSYAHDSRTTNDKYLLIIDKDYVLYPLNYYYLSDPHSIMDTHVNIETKKLLAKRTFTTLYLKKLNSFQSLPELPGGIQYSLVLPSCRLPKIKDVVLEKNIQSVYCAQYNERSTDLTFIRKK